MPTGYHSYKQGGEATTAPLPPFGFVAFYNSAAILFPSGGANSRRARLINNRNSVGQLGRKIFLAELLSDRVTGRSERKAS